MKLRGIALILIASAIPLLWTVPLASQLNTAAIVSQYFGSVSLILMAITQLIATRVRGIEAVFGSLDRVYGLHKWLGVGALLTAFLHAQIDAEAGNIALVRNLSDAAEAMGELGYSGLGMLALASLLTFIPYKLWKWSHRLIGLTFALAAAHFLYIEKPYAVFDFPGLYLTFFSVLGIVSYLYLLLPRVLGHNTRRYTVTDIVQRDAVTEVTLTPRGRPVQHRAGQFAFISFSPAALREAHPYTISSAPRADGSLRFLIKGLGSYTRRLGTTLELGMGARVSRPFGHFTLRPTPGPQVWIGAGIGITPFLAWAQTVDETWSTPTHLYYCVRTPDDLNHLAELEAASRRSPHLEVTPIVSKTGERLTAEWIARDLGGAVTDARVYFCGPTAMRNSLRSGLVQRGLRRRRFHNEAFEMRSGVGFRRILDRLRRTAGTDAHRAPVRVPAR